MSALVDRQDLKRTLRQRKTSAELHHHPVNMAHYDERTTGEKVADQLSAGMGSWAFLIIQTALMLVWVGVNGFWLTHRALDPYPFILLNLLLSLQATCAGPIVLLAGNRQSAKDRMTLEHAALEADKGGAQINEILNEIRKNTSLTLDILKELEGGA